MPEAVWNGLGWITGSFYLGGTMLLLLGLRNVLRRPVQSRARKEGLQAVSIIIPFRNEARNLPRLFQSLSRLEKPERLTVEWLWVDDHSEDDSVSLVENFILQNVLPGKSQILRSEGEGKKAALKTGVYHAIHPWVLLTDADTLWPAGRLRALEELEITPEVRLISAAVTYTSETPWLFRMEMEALVRAGAAFIGLGRPILCSGANLLCQRTAYLDCVEEIQNVPSPSGDDVFLMQCVTHRWGARSVKFLANPQLSVTTKGPHIWADFFFQRLRWASKTLYFRSGAAQAIALFVWAIHSAYLASLVFAPWMCSAAPLPWCVSWVWKIAADVIVMRMQVPWLRQRPALRHIVIAGIFMVLYVPLLGLLAQVLSFSWKNRTYPAAYEKKMVA
ncbi:MAG: glycosyltransferase [Flavobacteriales bacterium]|nr:glycosyltransferase [Flavobacteriales bacterium]